MRRAQELSLNLIVVGALALLVLLIIGGVMIFGGGELMGGLTSVGASEQEIAITSLQSACTSKCNILNSLVNGKTDLGLETTLQVKGYLWDYCCESYDLDADGVISEAGSYGPEYCALFYNCNIDGVYPSSYCTVVGGAAGGYYDNYAACLSGRP